MSPLPGLVLALLLLTSWTAAAQSPTERTVRVRRVPLTGIPIEVRVAPGIPTTLNFEADIDVQSVVLGATERVRLLAVAPRAITLVSVAELDAGVALHARFAEACLPSEPGFILRADAEEVDAQVTVYRDARAPELLRAQAAEWEARATTCESELATLRERGGVSLAALVLSGELDGRGVRVDSLQCEGGFRASGLECYGVMRFLSVVRVVVFIRLLNAPGHPVWRRGRAWLVSESSGERFEARVVALEPAAFAPGADGTLVLEFPRPPVDAGADFRLEAQDAEGTRHLSIAHVTMDALAEPAQGKKDGP
ncbi:DUF2381 family protein [Pyxidicoccus parkwayensis]|uniref:DUF2381 family protein n=1 Tax=Pyxidicoccus parkwayensis TaxID=2813578 RepID=A0ABX7NZ03_9BACT|nr:DUF2381 family protein [Pyxidicoccus parkwaysis]QSQ23698.1 DUF2381 family protein [Pyxidicoccus parkwaysis]